MRIQVGLTKQTVFMTAANRGRKDSKLKGPRTVGPGLEVIRAQKARILEYNKKLKGGIIRSDESGAVRTSQNKILRKDKKPR
jgi:hypothetical protein